MARAPYIRPIKVQGGTFYTFTSSQEDIGLTFGNDTRKFGFSKFALLNVPNMLAPVSGQNYIQFNAIPTGYENVTGVNRNLHLAESFQNYCLNLETMLISQDDYEVDTLYTTTERVFFKWLKELGAMRYRLGNVEEVDPLISGLRWREEDSSATYNRVVEYIGNVQIVNNVKNNKNAYAEVYVNVPAHHGNTPTVLFKVVEDANYRSNRFIQNNPANPLDQDYLFGREHTDTHPAGLNTRGFFDSQYNTFTGPTYTLKLKDSLGTYNTGWWYTNPERNSYQFPSVFTDAGNDELKIQGTTGDVYVKRSRLDGVTLDFNPASYKQITDNSSIHSIDEFNEKGNSTGFDFNAILIYYDIQDVSSGETATNLFGVLFLDDVQNLSTGGGEIPRLKKFKSSAITKENGTSFGFSINVKFDINSEDSPIEININEYNTFSMQLFIEALNQFKEASRILSERNEEISQLRTQFDELRTLVLTNEQFVDIDERLDNLQTIFDNSDAVFQSNDALVSLIDRNYSEIMNIYRNVSSVQMTYNLDTFLQDEGIYIDKSTQDRIKVKNVVQNYNFTLDPIFDIAGLLPKPTRFELERKLDTFTNYIRIHNNGSPYLATKDIYVFVNDFSSSWKKGQVFSVSFPDEMIMSNVNGDFNIYFYTDFLNRLQAPTPYSGYMATITFQDFYALGGKGKFDIICLDPQNFLFTVDKIKII